MDSEMLKDCDISDDDDSVRNIKVSKPKLIFSSDDSEEEKDIKGRNYNEDIFSASSSKKVDNASDSQNNDPAESVDSEEIASPNEIKEHEVLQPDSLKFPEINTEDFLSQGTGKIIMNSDIYDAEESDEEINSRSRTQQEDESNTRKNTDIYDADESDEEIISRSRTQEESYFRKDNNIYDAEGSSDEGSKENYYRNNEDKFPEKSEKHKTKAKKKPEKKVENKIDEIHKESQRMVRESHISLPYHRPKQRTLSDFLNRRKSVPIVPLRTSNDHLSKVWKHLEEREKTVETFYKSESSSEDENFKARDDKKIEDNNCKQQVDESEAEKIEDCTKLQMTDSEDLKINDFSKTEFDETERSDENLNSNEPANESICDSLRENSDKICETVCSSEITDDVKTTEVIENSDICVAKEILNCEQLVLTEDSAKQDMSTVKLIDTSTDICNHKGNGKISDAKNIFDESLFPLEFTPKLTADEGDFVELDGDQKKKPGPIGLMTRFIKHVKLKQNSSKLLESSEENSVFEQTDLKIEEKEVVTMGKEMKPGQRFVLLKHSLKLSIDANRSQMFNSKIQQQQLYEEEFCELLGIENKDKDSEEDISDEDTILDEKENKQTVDKVYNSEKSDDGEEDGDDNEEIEEEEDAAEDEELEEDDFCSKKQNKSGGKLFLDEEASESDDSGCDDGSDSDSAEKHSKLSNQDLLGKYPDFGNESLRREPSDTDLLGICSGQFQTQPIDLLQLEKPTQKYDFLSDDDSNQKLSDVDSENSVDENTKRVDYISKVIESDDEDTKNISTNLKTQKSKQRKLVFSDDEEVDNGKDETEFSSSEEKISEGENSEVEAEENEEKVVDYNSEEEVIEGKKFLDVEAELSGSEWGSEDENEEGLSDFEADQADLEKIDQTKLRRDIGRIHLQELLAEDKREVRLIKEMLLEDGELHSDGPKRQRLYRWSNQGGYIPLKNTDDPMDELNQDEEIEDVEWRLQRIEREKFITDNLKIEDNIEFEVNVPLGSIDKKKKNLQPKPSKINPDPISPDPKQPFKILTKRGSFLGRGEKVLSRLAGLVPTDSNNSRVKRNMVFSVVSPPKEEAKSHSDQDFTSTEKRKAVEDIPKVTKKLKFSAVKKNSSIFEKLKD